MTDIELTILRHLYINPIEVNFTKSVLNNSLGFDKSVLEENLQNLIDNKYVEKVYTDGTDGNQYKMNDPCYRITGFGAKKINEIDSKDIVAAIARYGTMISVVGGIIASIGVGAKIYFDKRTDNRGEKQLYIQCRLLYIQKELLQHKQADTTTYLQNKKNQQMDSCVFPSQ